MPADVVAGGVPHARPRRVPVAALLLAALTACAAGCAPKVRLALPDGSGTAVVDLPAVVTAARASCRAPQALSADLRLSGRIDGSRVRGTLQVGVAADAMRLEGVAPFGAPVFVLAARPDRAVLLLPREDAVARAASADQLLDAVVGVALGAADLRAIVSGCGLAAWTADGASTFRGGWTRVDAGPGRRLWLRAAGGDAAVILAAEDGEWRVEYRRTGTGWPTAIRLIDTAGRGTDAVFGVDAPEALDALPEGALDVDVPATAREVTLADLRTRRALTER